MGVSPPVRTHESRKKTVFRDKSDIKDAEKIVSELTRRLYELPLLTKKSENTIYTAINQLSLYRDELVKEQAAIKNQLHNLFHKINPDYKENFRTIFSQKAIRYWQSRVKRIENKNQDVLQLNRAIVMGLKLKRLKQLIQEIKVIEQKLKPLVAKTSQRLETILGINTVATARIIGETRDISRFKGPDKYVRYAGIAPRESSSGKQIKFRKSKSGNRRLNQTIYLIALTQIRIDPKVKEYFIRKVSEGKSRKQAITCVMRRIAIIIYGILRTQGAYQGQRCQKQAFSENQLKNDPLKCSLAAVSSPR